MALIQLCIILLFGIFLVDTIPREVKIRRIKKFDDASCAKNQQDCSLECMDKNAKCCKKGKTFWCRCVKGFHAKRGENGRLYCEDVNECLYNELNNCPVSKCVNLERGYKCEAKAGESKSNEEAGESNSNEIGSNEEGKPGESNSNEIGSNEEGKPGESKSNEIGSNEEGKPGESKSNEIGSNEEGKPGESNSNEIGQTKKEEENKSENTAEEEKNEESQVAKMKGGKKGTSKKTIMIMAGLIVGTIALVGVALFGMKMFKSKSGAPDIETIWQE